MDRRIYAGGSRQLHDRLVIIAGLRFGVQDHSFSDGWKGTRGCDRFDTDARNVKGDVVLAVFFVGGLDRGAKAAFASGGISIYIADVVRYVIVRLSVVTLTTILI